MKPLASFLLGYGAGVGTLLLVPRLRFMALRVASRLLRRVESALARAEARREDPGPLLAGASAQTQVLRAPTALASRPVGT